MCAIMNLDSGVPEQEMFLGPWNSLVYMYTGMNLTKPRDRPVAFQGITSYISRLSSNNAYRGGGTGVTFFDGLPVPFLLPSLLWRVVGTKGGRARQSIITSSTKTCVVAECYVNTLSWASVEGEVRCPYEWPVCAAPRPATTIFAPGFNSGTFKLQKRVQIIELFHDPKPCKDADTGHDKEPVHIPEWKVSYPDIAAYRYCTRLVSLIHVHNLLSRVILEGPTFILTTPSTCKSSTLAPGGCMANWHHPEKGHRRTDSFNLFNLDLGSLRDSCSGLALQVTCLTVIEWELSRNGERRMDMAGENVETWQPDCAAGIVLIKGNDGKGLYHDKVEETYTRIGYWELLKSNEYHPPYGPIRKEPKVRRVVVI